MKMDMIGGNFEPVSAAELEAIEAAALSILDDVGLAVENAWLVRKLTSLGFRNSATGRFRVPKDETRRFLADVRRRNGNAFSTRPAPQPDPPPRMTLDPSHYSLYVHDFDTGKAEPFTVASQAGTLHLVEALRSQGLTTTWVAQPSDVPGPLRPLMQYWLAGLCLSEPVTDNLLQSPHSLPYELAMSEALGRPIDNGVMFVFSPLRLIGESLDCVVQARDRFKAVYVGNMPTAGSSAPIRPAEALAMGAAETIGAAILLQAALDLPAHFGFGLFPANMRSLSISFGSPELYLLQIVCSEVNAFFHGHAWRPWSADLHIGACATGPQAIFEKASVFAAGALFGNRHFTGAGVLATDEVFSPEQLLYDMEMRDHYQRVTAGWDMGCDVERALNDVREGVELGSFAGLESTVNLHRKSYWTPGLFFRGSLGSWRAAGEPDSRRAVADRLRELRSMPHYRPPQDRMRALNRILAEAQSVLGTNYSPPDEIQRTCRA